VISKFPGVLNGPPDRVDGDPCEVEDVLEEVASELLEEVASELLDALLEPPRPKL
jgi:hypothetical protein